MTTATDYETDARMQNAFYWAAQAEGWMQNGPNAGIDGRYYVEVIGGKPVVVLDESFNPETTQAVVDGLRDYGFPKTIRTRELETETRLFIVPNDERLVANYYAGDWREFEATGGFD